MLRKEEAWEKVFCTAILFSPHKKSIDIRVSREEQIIIFTLGILGLIHTNWNYFEKFLIEIKSLN